MIFQDTYLPAQGLLASLLEASPQVLEVMSGTLTDAAVQAVVKAEQIDVNQSESEYKLPEPLSVPFPCSNHLVGALFLPGLHCLVSGSQVCRAIHPEQCSQT
mmetsp:Transcript_48079/g.75088  ORF Transcript_48079/g.75088 Transcript_48079/m.75088 type:complete len:102 (+) Transcript_48079:89-394(+)